MEFFDKLTKKATETYKGAAEKTGKIAKETKLRLKINENKAKINSIYEEIGKKVYQKHAQEGDICIKEELKEECAKIDALSDEIEKYNREILALSNQKECVECKEKLQKGAKFCPKCGAKQPEEVEEKVDGNIEVFEAEIVESSNGVEEESEKENNENIKEAVSEDENINHAQSEDSDEADKNGVQENTEPQE